MVLLLHYPSSLTRHVEDFKTLPYLVMLVKILKVWFICTRLSSVSYFMHVCPMSHRPVEYLIICILTKKLYYLLYIVLLQPANICSKASIWQIYCHYQPMAIIKAFIKKKVFSLLPIVKVVLSKEKLINQVIIFFSLRMYISYLWDWFSVASDKFPIWIEQTTSSNWHLIHA